MKAEVWFGPIDPAITTLGVTGDFLVGRFLLVIVLPATVDHAIQIAILEERVIGPTLGRDAINQAIKKLRPRYGRMLKNLAE